ncbi:MAG: hypothetical protein [Microvirus sp.]|nr:MAG: hypothetical protein [Microvirus sp.]
MSFKRKKMGRYKSRRQFKKYSGTHKKNVSYGSMRDGIRL